MLKELRIDNFAIIQHLELEFGNGLITFTGETGAGKSIILDAIEAVVGGKTDGSMIRSGAERASVEATFRIPDANRAVLVKLLEQEDLMEDDQFVVLSRELRREGRSGARINGRSASLGLVREIGSYLIDIHGQSEHLSLLNVRQHLSLLDHFSGVAEIAAAYRKTYDEISGLRKELNGLRQSEQDAERRTDLLSYQLKEIDDAHVRLGEDLELKQERDRLANAENLSSLIQQSLTVLDEGSPESPAVTDQVGQIVQAISSLQRIDSSQSGLVEQINTIEELLSSLALDLRNYLDQIEYNPRRLAQIEDRLDMLYKLQRKYGGSLENALAFAEKSRAELETIAHASERIGELEELEKKALAKLAQHAQSLSQKRRAAAGAMEKGVELELQELSMSGARFSVDFQILPDPNGLDLGNETLAAFDATGVDRVEFLIAPNPGEGLKPLAKIASGGETSRLMLALKNVLAKADAVPTLIFDEIDQGIGGRVGTVVGEKLWQLGRRHQVLCVTHLPQLAAFGDQHFRVVKKVDGGRTSTEVERLVNAARTGELAQMLGSQSQANLSAAQETLQMAKKRTMELGSGM